MARRPRKQQVTRTISDTRSLEQYLRGTGKGACKLTLPGLREENAERWERLLSRLQTTCGCTPGLIAGVIGFAVWLTLALGNAASLMTARTLAAGLASIVIPAVTAKFATLAITALRLRRAGRALLAELEIVSALGT